MNNKKRLYSDSLVELTEEAIYFRHYYFLAGGSRSIPLIDIVRFEQKPPILANEKWRLAETSDFRRWFPVDWSRPKRDAIFLLIRSGNKKKIGLTAENTKQLAGGC